MSNINGRVKKLEKLLNRPEDRSELPQSDAEWLVLFEQWGEQGYFEGEPDFPLALDAYRKAVKASAPNSRNLPEWNWLAEMWERVKDGKPPITEAEFNELAEWFQQNEARIVGLIDIGDGRHVDRVNIRCKLSHGPRGMGVTELVEDLRRLRDVLG